MHLNGNGPLCLETLPCIYLKCPFYYGKIYVDSTILTMCKGLLL